MNELNQLIKELKQTAEEILKIADALDEKIAASADEPKKPAKSKKKEEPAKIIDLSDVKALLMEKARSGLNEEVHALIQSYGVEKLSAIDPANYEDLMKKAEELGNG